jgi:hypothetical protein
VRERTQLELWIKMLATTWVAYYIFKGFFTMVAIIWLRFVLPVIP